MASKDVGSEPGSAPPSGGTRHQLAAGSGSTTDDDMCPNCVTPWKCNGPHVSSEQEGT